MQVRRFTAASTAEALRKVKKELGPQAVILGTSSIAGGRVEVSAALERNDASGPSIGELAAQVKGLGRLLNRHLLANEAAEGFGQRPEVAPVYQHLLAQEVDPAVIAELLDDLVAAPGHGVAPRVGIRLKKMLEVAPPTRLSGGGRAMWALVGPTGVGKTTTVAKLAASFSIKYGLKVGMITVDTFRIAAPQQLQIYGEIMDLPTVVAADAAELAEAAAAMADRDLILVDTVGRAPANREHLDDLQSVLAGLAGLQCHLVLACPTREADQKAAAEAYARFKPASLIFTKLDETSTFGGILNRVAQTGWPVSYVTFGQRVPEDIEAATREGLARRLMPPRTAAPGV